MCKVDLLSHKSRRIIKIRGNLVSLHGTCFGVMKYPCSLNNYEIQFYNWMYNASRVPGTMVWKERSNYSINFESFKWPTRRLQLVAKQQYTGIGCFYLVSLIFFNFFMYLLTVCNIIYYIIADCRLSL